MTTPLCNEGCSESVGWLPETSWPFTETSKDAAQPIYCLSGSPAVPPRGLYVANYGEARQDSSGTGRLLGNSGAITNLTGVSETSVTVSNTTAYNLDVFGMWTAVIQQLSIASDAVYRFTTTISDTSSGTPVAIVASNQVEYGVNSLTQVPWRQMNNINYRYLKTIAPASTSTFIIRTTWLKTAGTTGSNDKFNSFGSVLRIMAGNS